MKKRTEEEKSRTQWEYHVTEALQRLEEAKSQLEFCLGYVLGTPDEMHELEGARGSLAAAFERTGKVVDGFGTKRESPTANPPKSAIVG